MKNNRIGNVLRNSAYYTIGMLLTKATAFFLLPVYTYFLSTAEYGTVNLISTFVTVASVVILFALDQGQYRFYEEFKEERHKYFGTIITFEILVSVIVFIILVLTNKYVTKFLLKGVDFFPIVLLGLIALLFHAIYSIGQSALQTQQNGREYTINSIIFMVIYASLNVAFLAFCHMQALGMILSLALSNIIMASKTIFSLYKQGDFCFCLDKIILKKVVRYSLPLIPHTLANNIATFISLFFLNIQKSISMVGIYSIGSQLGSILDMIQSALNLAFRPWFNENIAQGDDGKNRIIEFADSVFIISSLICLGISLFSKEVVYIMTSYKYHEAWKIVPIFSLAHAIKFIYYTHSLAVMYDLKASKRLSICSVTASLVNIGLCAFLIPLWNIYGAAISFLISRVVLTIMTVPISLQTGLIRYKLTNMITNVIIIAITSGLGLSFSYLGFCNGLNVAEFLFKIVLYTFVSSILVWKRKNQITEIVLRILGKNGILNKFRLR